MICSVLDKNFKFPEVNPEFDSVSYRYVIYSLVSKNINGLANLLFRDEFALGKVVSYYLKANGKKEQLCKALQEGIEKEAIRIKHIIIKHGNTFTTTFLDDKVVVIEVPDVQSGIKAYRHIRGITNQMPSVSFSDGELDKVRGNEINISQSQKLVKNSKKLEFIFVSLIIFGVLVFVMSNQRGGHGG